MTHRMELPQSDSRAVLLGDVSNLRLQSQYKTLTSAKTFRCLFAYWQCQNRTHKRKRKSLRVWELLRPLIPPAWNGSPENISRYASTH